jgi:hypothetical protein
VRRSVRRRSCGAPSGRPCLPACRCRVTSQSPLRAPSAAHRRNRGSGGGPAPVVAAHPHQRDGRPSLRRSTRWRQTPRLTFTSLLPRTPSACDRNK